MSNLLSLQESLAKKQAEVANLEKELATAREAQFTELPGKLGLDSIDAVIKVLAGYASPRLKAALKKALGEKTIAAAPKAEAKPVAAAKPERRKRAKVTPELKAEIVTALQAGDKTAAQVAEAFGVSGATVNNIKRDAGLTKKKAQA